jgi:hypothetical protein
MHDEKHDCEALDCGDEALNDFLRRYARKSHELGGEKTFLAIDDAEHLVALHGFLKKTRATPNEDLVAARKRQRDLK